MEWLSSVLLAVQVISSLSIIVLVLLQQGKGSEMGAAFGSGSAGSLFGASGAANFLSRSTKWAAIIFFASTAGLAYVAHHPGGAAKAEAGGVMQGFESSVPATPNTGSAVPSAPGSAVPTAPAPAPAETPAAPAEAPEAAAETPAAPAAEDAPAASSDTAEPAAKQ